MRRETLVDLFSDLETTRGEFLVYDDGFRRRRWTYADTARAARAFASRLHRQDIRSGDHLVLWAENRPEWIAAFWGCVLCGVVVVPVDYRSSPDVVRRICDVVSARALVVGDDVEGVDRLTGALADGDASSTLWHLSTFEWERPATVTPADTRADDPAEVIFTSGATSDPKGVILTHRNILANLVPVEREILKYRKWGRPFFPLRFLDLLPLSHMFGQSMATFIPPMLPGTTIFMRSHNPRDLVAQIGQRRISVLVSVPKILEVLREFVAAAAPSAAHPSPPGTHWTVRWWRHRDAHRLFGAKFWCFVVGGAPLDPELEAFWSALGFLVVQGYGLTETAPIVTLNHPFAARRGSVGKPIAGLEVRIADDGEILVRGDNVMQGYFNAPDATAAVFDGGWLRTGDIGEIDESGRLYVRGRKKEMIVLADGLNVFPDDVERVLVEVPGVREAAVVGLAEGKAERVHAVLVVDPHMSADEAIRIANQRLPASQRIRSASSWPGEHLPRTDGTAKLKRVEIREWAAGQRQANPTAPSAATPLAELFGKYAAGRSLRPDMTIEELGLSSLERIELLVAAEQRYRTSIDETAFGAARTLADVQALVEAPVRSGSRDEPVAPPLWPLSWWARGLRRILVPVLILPLTRLFARVRVAGLEHLGGDASAVVFAANHQSHMDTPVIMAALPASLRYRLAPAMAKEFFSAHFAPQGRSRRERWTSRLLYTLAVLAFNAFPIPQRESGARQTLRHVGELASRGFSVLIFPEGRRTDGGEIRPFQPGVAMMGRRLDLPVVPVRLEGVDRVLHSSWRWPKRGPVRVVFGPPVRVSRDDFVGAAAEIERAVRGLGEDGPSLA